MPLPNRIAVYLTAAAALLAGLLPLVGNLDWQSTAGVIAGLIAILGVAIKWLDGWQKYEQRSEPEAPELDDEFSEQDAEVPEDVQALAHADVPEEGGTTYGQQGSTPRRA